MNSLKCRHETPSARKAEGHLHITASQGHQVFKKCCKEYLRRYIEWGKDAEKPLKSVRKKNVRDGISKITKKSFVPVEIQDCQRQTRTVAAGANTGHRLLLAEMTQRYNLLKHRLI